MSPSHDRPTPKQLAAVKRLALERGRTFTLPTTRREVDDLFRELLAERPQPRKDLRRLDRQVADDVAGGRGGAAVPLRDDEVSGECSSARLTAPSWFWKSEVVIPEASGPIDRTGTNPAVEIARYCPSGEDERVIRSQRVSGSVRLTDSPVSGRGRAYLIESGITSRAELEAIATDYLAQAERHDGPPARALWEVAA